MRERGGRREREGGRRKFLRRERTAKESRILVGTGKERAQKGRRPGGKTEGAIRGATTYGGVAGIFLWCRSKYPAFNVLLEDHLDSHHVHNAMPSPWTSNLANHNFITLKPISVL